MRAAGVAGLALAVDGEERRNGVGKVGDEAIARAAGSREVRAAAGVADGSHVAADRFAAMVEKLAEVAAGRENVLERQTMEAAPMPGGHVGAELAGKLVERG